MINELSMLVYKYTINENNIKQVSHVSEFSIL